MAHRNSLNGFCAQFVSSVFQVARRCSSWTAERSARLNLTSPSPARGSLLTVQVNALLGPVDLGREFAEKTPSRMGKASSILMQLEGLEERRLLSSVGLDNGVLRLDGSTNDVNLMSVVTADRNHLTATVNDNNMTVDLNQVKSIQITGGDQSDSIYVASDITIGANINGLGGNDFIQGGGGNDVIHGGGGDDYISAGGGHNSLFTDGGQDNLVVNPTTDSYNVGGGAGQITDVRNGSMLPNRSSTTTPTTPTTPTQPTTPTEPTQPTTPTEPTQPTTPTEPTEPTTPTEPTQPTTPTEPTQPTTPTEPTEPTTPTEPTQPTTPTEPTDTGTDGQDGSGQAPAGGDSGSTPPSDDNWNDGTQNNGGATPTAKVNAMETTVTAGAAIHVDAVNSSLGAGDPTTARYEWNFGDSGSQYNTLEGFNAAHAYDKAGTYTITLRVTNELGNQSVATQKVTINQDNRRTIYVASDGNDSNSGLSENAAVRSIDRVQQLLQDNTRVLFKAGQSFDLYTGLIIRQNNVLIGSYGSGNRPTLNWRDGNPNGQASFIDAGGKDVVVQGLSFNTPADSNRADEGSPFAIQLRGQNTTVRDNEFLHLGYAINGNGKPTGVLIENNVAPLAVGLQGYFAWCEGSNYTIVGNTAANSTREHIVRMEQTRLMNVSYNNFTNLDRRGLGDAADNAKGTIVVHENQYVWIAHNTINDGPIGTGPLMIPGVPDAARSQWSVIDSNTINNAVLIADTGTDGAVIRNNIIHPPAASGYGIQVTGYSSTYQRGVENLRLLNNTVVSNLSTGGFLFLSGKADGITMDNNLFVDHSLLTGANQTALVYVVGTDLSSFREIKGNVWDIPNTVSYAQGGFFYIWPSWSDSQGYQTPQEWSAHSQVSGDLFGHISLDSHNTPLTDLAASGISATKGVFTDFYGILRPADGSWSAGAVQA
jgi:hypothetical protein